jgi:hypothetical protein
VAGVASMSCCNFAVAEVPGAAESRRRHLLGDGVFVALVAESLEVLAFELGELDAVGGVADVEVKRGPDLPCVSRRRSSFNRLVRT